MYCNLSSYTLKLIQEALKEHGMGVYAILIDFTVRNQKMSNILKKMWGAKEADKVGSYNFKRC